MHKLEWMKETIIEEVAKQFCNLNNVNTCELGEAVDIIKDLSEAIYYCTITEAMKGEDDREDSRKYYGGKHADRMEPSGHHMEHDVEAEWRSPHEGKSPMSRKAYLESKAHHKDKVIQMQELEKYAQELTTDLVEMVEDSSPEEKQYLSNRIAALAAKIK